MIICDISIGRFSIIAQREPDWRSLNVTREDAGEIAIDLPFVCIFLKNERRSVVRSK